MRRAETAVAVRPVGMEGAVTSGPVVPPTGVVMSLWISDWVNTRS